MKHRLKCTWHIRLLQFFRVKVLWSGRKRCNKPVKMPRYKLLPFKHCRRPSEHVEMQPTVHNRFWKHVKPFTHRVTPRCFTERNHSLFITTQSGLSFTNSSIFGLSTFGVSSYWLFVNNGTSCVAKAWRNFVAGTDMLICSGEVRKYCGGVMGWCDWTDIWFVSMVKSYMYSIF